MEGTESVWLDGSAGYKTCFFDGGPSHSYPTLRLPPSKIATNQRHVCAWSRPPKTASRICMAFFSFEKYNLISRVLAAAVEREPKKRTRGKHVFDWVRAENQLITNICRCLLQNQPQRLPCPSSSPVCAFSCNKPERLSCYAKLCHADKIAASPPWRV